MPHSPQNQQDCVFLYFGLYHKATGKTPNKFHCNVPSTWSEPTGSPSFLPDVTIHQKILFHGISNTDVMVSQSTKEFFVPERNQAFGSWPPNLRTSLSYLQGNIKFPHRLRGFFKGIKMQKKLRPDLNTAATSGTTLHFSIPLQKCLHILPTGLHQADAHLT